MLLRPSFRFTRDRRLGCPILLRVALRGGHVSSLTGKDESKESQLNDYKQLDPRYLSSVHGLPPQSGVPDTLSSRLDPFHDGEFCQLAVRSQLIIQNVDKIQNIKLRDCLLEVQNIDLSRLPTIPVSLVPESKHLEIRKGIIDIIMLLFDEKCEGFTTDEIARKALDKLEARTPDKKITELANNIDRELQIAVKEHLKGYIEFKKNRYNAGKKFWKYPVSRQKITKLLLEWANEPQAKLDNWWKKGSNNNQLHSTKAIKKH